MKFDTGEPWVPLDQQADGFSQLPFQGNHDSAAEMVIPFRSDEKEDVDSVKPLVRDLYAQYADGVAATLSKAEMTFRSAQLSGWEPRVQFDDLESEMLYLLIRDTAPQTVVEVSPCDGWSSLWMLQALKDNDSGQLHSYDLHSGATRFIPEELKNRWSFTEVDVRTLDDFPEQIDFLLIDSAHTGSFANWYIRTLLPRMAPDAPVVIHDMERLTAFFPGSEGGKVRRLLRQAGEPSWTLSSRTFAGKQRAEEVRKNRREVGLPNHEIATQRNPAIFLRASRTLIDFAQRN